MFICWRFGGRADARPAAQAASSGESAVRCQGELLQTSYVYIYIYIYIHIQTHIHFIIDNNNIAQGAG